MSVQNPTIPTATQAKGIDAVVLDLQTHLDTELVWLTNGMGRAYRLTKVEVNKAAFFLPEVYLGTDQYTYFAATPDNDKKGQSIFIVGPSTYPDQQLGFFGLMQYEVSIIFSTNLKLINATLLETEYFEEHQIEDVRQALIRNLLGKAYKLTVNEVVREFEDVYTEFDVTSDRGIAHAPMSYFRFNCTVLVKEDCLGVSLDRCGAIVQNISDNDICNCLAQTFVFTPAGFIWECFSAQQQQDIRNRACWTAGTVQGGCLLVYGNNLYGASTDGGANSLGYIWVMSLSDPTFTAQTIYNFQVANRTMITQEGGLLYGVTDAGGANGLGFMYSIHPTTFAFTQLSDLSVGTGYKLNLVPPSPLVVTINTSFFGANGYLFVATRLGRSGNGGLFRYQISSDTITVLTPAFTSDSSAFQNFTQIGVTTYEYSVGALKSMLTTSSVTTTLTTDPVHNSTEVPSNMVVFNGDIIYGTRTIADGTLLYQYNPTTTVKTLITAVSNPVLNLFYRALAVYNNNLYVFDTINLYILNSSFVVQSVTALPSNMVCPGELTGNFYYLRVVNGITTDLYELDMTLLIFTLIPQVFMG